MQEQQLLTRRFSPETSYEDVLAAQEQAVADVYNSNTPEQLFMVEHAPVYTLGTSAQNSDVLNINDIPAVPTGRGGQVTYHGPGQRVLYPILDLRERGRDVRCYVCDLQRWIIQTLKEFNINAFSEDQIGVWVQTSSGPAKIAAIGVRVRKWITFHGVALNINPDLSHFQGIIPCGITDKGVTSMHKLGQCASMEEVDKALIANFNKIFY